MTSEAERRDQTVRVRATAGDLESWRRAAPGGNVSMWLRRAASRAVSSHATVAGADLERGAPVEVVELRATASEAASWREAAGDDGVASWLRGVAACELSRLGAPASLAAPERSGPAASSAAPSGLAFAGEDAEDRRRRAMTLADVLACTHPEGDRKRTGYMVICVRCGRRSSGRDSWSGAGYAGWTPSWQATCPHPDGERISRPWGPVCGVCGTLVG